jgi:hypothetical protein
LLYRGDDPGAPTEIWDYPRKRWVPYHGGPFHGAPGRVLDDAEAEQLKVNNAAAEHFMYYDIPPWLQQLSPEYLDAVMPPGVKEAIAARRRLLGKGDPE